MRAPASSAPGGRRARRRGFRGRLGFPRSGSGSGAAAAKSSGSGSGPGGGHRVHVADLRPQRGQALGQPLAAVRRPSSSVESSACRSSSLASMPSRPPRRARMGLRLAAPRPRACPRHRARRPRGSGGPARGPGGQRRRRRRTAAARAALDLVGHGAQVRVDGLLLVSAASDGKSRRSISSRSTAVRIRHRSALTSWRIAWAEKWVRPCSAPACRRRPRGRPAAAPRPRRRSGT